MSENTQPQPITVPEFTPVLTGYRAEEFLTLTETLLAFPLEQNVKRLNAAPFRIDRPEPRPEPPLPVLPPRWYPRLDPAVIEAAQARLVPPPRPVIVEGRTSELTRVLRPLLSGNPVQVRGEAGIGKTTLLAMVATHERTRQRFRRIWWIDAPDQLDQTLALTLNLPHVVAESDPAQRREWLASHLDDHTLLVIDNATPDNVDWEQLITLTPNVLLALETEPVPPSLEEPDDPLIERPTDPPGVVTLRALDDAMAIEALARHAGIDDTRRIRDELLEIVTVLGHHPYALALAGILIRRDGLTLDELADLLVLPEVDPAEVSTETPGDEWEDADDADDPLAYLASLNRALDVSFAGLPRGYQRLFEAFGAFPLIGAPFDGLHSVARIGDELATRRGLAMLADYGFIVRDHRDPDVYRMYPVAHARAVALDPDGKTVRKMISWAGRYWRQYADQPLAIYRASASLLYAHEREPNTALMPFLRDYVPGAEQGADPVIPEEGPRAEAAELTQAGIMLTDQGEIEQAEVVLKRALALQQSHANDHAIAETLVAWGRLLDMIGHYEEAANRLIAAAELVYNLGAEDSLSVIRRGLARVYRHLERLNEALGVLDDAPEAHFERAQVLRAQGNYAAAVAEMKLAGDDAPYIRAETYVLAGRYAEALEVIAEAEDPDSAHLRAQIYHLQGSVDEAIRGYEVALELCGDHELARAKTLRGLGAAFASAGRYDDAQDVLEKALAIHENDEAPNPMLIGRTLRLLAAVHLAAGQLTTALAAGREAVQQLGKTAAPDDLAYAYHTIGRVLWAQGDHAGALEAFNQEVEYAQSTSERDDARIGVALHHVGDAYRATGELDRAVANYRRALTHKSPDDDRDDYLITQLALRRVLMETSRHAAALDVSQEIVDRLNAQSTPDLGQLGYAQALRARAQQAVARPTRAQHTLEEWTQTLAVRSDEAATDERAGLRALIFGLAARSLLAEERPKLALVMAQHSQAVTATHFDDHPVHWAAQRDVAEAHFALGETDDAILTCDPLLKDEVRDHTDQGALFASVHALTGEAYHQLGDIGSALDHLEIAVNNEPVDHLKALLLEQIAHIQLDVGQPGLAVESLQAMLPLVDRKDHLEVLARALTRLARTLGGLNRYAEAIGVYEDALAALRDVAGVDPTHTADVLHSLGATHEAQGQRPEAAQAYRRALNLLERSDAPRQQRDILHALARVSAEMGEQSAVQLYEQVRDATAEIGEPGELGSVLRELADVHRDGGRLPLAVLNYQSALEHQPAQLLLRDRIATLRNMGRALAQMERYDEARSAWTEALDLSNDLPDSSPLEVGLTYHAIAEAHRSQRNYDDAEQSFREALQHLAPATVESAATWRALGQAQHADERFTDAVESFKKALDAEKAQPQQVNIRLVETLQLMAASFEAQEKFDAAITRYHEALVYMDRDLQPVTYANTLRTLAELYRANRNYPQALKALDEALDIEGEHVPRSEDRITQTLQMIADTYRASGDLQTAAEYYQKVTVYANFARRVSDDLRDTLNELDRRRETLRAAQQSLLLLDRADQSGIKELAFIHALIAHSYARLNQPQEAADAIHTLLDIIEQRRDELSTDDTDGDTRALAWLATASDAERDDDIDTAQFACGAALDSVRNANLRWVIEQWARALD